MIRKLYTRRTVAQSLSIPDGRTLENETFRQVAIGELQIGSRTYKVYDEQGIKNLIALQNKKQTNEQND